MQKSRYVADVHHLRLMSLLNELVREKGNKGAARVLGIDRRTVAASVRSARSSDRTRATERIMELEIAMIDEHGLTLSPANSPMHPSEKSVHLGWRVRTLEDLRKERGKLEFLGRVRRVLTLGLWRT